MKSISRARLVHRGLTAVRAVLIAWVILVAAPPDLSAALEGSEASVKTAYLYNFALFVEWPSGAFRSISAPLNICVTGQSLGSAVSSLRGKEVKGRTIAVLKLENMTDAGHCHIVFIGQSERRGYRQILSDLRKRPVLTVSDIESFVDSGGMIGLVFSDERIRFEINPSAAELAGLQVSSRLLRLAAGIRDRE